MTDQTFHSRTSLLTIDMLSFFLLFPKYQCNLHSYNKPKEKSTQFVNCCIQYTIYLLYCSLWPSPFVKKLSIAWVNCILQKRHLFKVKSDNNRHNNILKAKTFHSTNSEPSNPINSIVSLLHSSNCIGIVPRIIGQLVCIPISLANQIVLEHCQALVQCHGKRRPSFVCSQT